MSLDWNYSQLCLINLKGYMLLSIILAVTFGEYLDRGGGGRLVDPPGRSSLWRLNDTLYPINTNDHRVNCGGFEVHWLKNKGECGICGDPIDETRDHENGGKYHVDFVSETFLQNEIINVTVETISDMFGYFEFRICPYNDDQSVTKECLNKNILEIGDTGYTRYKVWYQGYHVIPLQLPADLKCDKCLLQFQYHTGYLWGCDGDNCCYGCGPMQEEFYSCADIKILPDDTFKFNSLKRANFNKESSPYMEWWCIFQCVGEECMTPICSKQAHLRTKRQTRTCKAAGVWSGRTEMDNWCTTNCLSQRPYCPASHCKCESDSDSNVPTTTTQATTTPGKLQVTVSPSQFTSVIGDASVQIRCDITGSPPAITWYWIKIPFTSGYSTIIYQGTNNQNYRVEGSSTGPHLTIKDITVNDQADYMCVAVSVIGTTLSLKSRLYVEGDIPTVTVEPVTFTSNIGDSSFQILCSITGRPQATDWYWTITPVSGSSSTKIPKGTDDDKYSINNSATNPHLTIKNITSDDEADYVCWATNAVGTNSSPKSRLLVTGGNVPNIVRVMASAGCQYCNDKNNMTCSEWYCPEEYTVNIGLSGSLTSKVNQMADDFCTMCSHNDTACKELFCLPNRRMVSLAIQARCNLCSVSGMNCPDDPECVSSSDLQSGELSTTGCKAIGDWEGQAGMDMWCQNNCPNPGSCPSSHCLCSDFLNTGRLNSLTCTGAGAWVYSQAMAAWCNRNCPGNCPASHCSCVSPQTTPITTMTTTTQRTTTRTIETTITIPLDTDLYSANAMNGIMCSICKKDGSYSGCSSKYCELYNPTVDISDGEIIKCPRGINLEEPNDSLNRVYTFSPAIFCQLAVKEGDTDLQKLFCGDIFAEVLPELQTVMCTACQDVGNGNGCEAYCG